MKLSSPRAFTLVELMVAFAVTTILVVLMLGMVNNLLPLYQRGTGSLLTQGQADLILEQLATDLESLVLTNSPEPMLRVRMGAPPDGGSKTNRRGHTGTDGVFKAGFPADPISGDPDDPTNPPGFPPLSGYFFGHGGADITFFTRAPAFLTEDSDGVSNESIRAVRYRLVRRPVTSAPDAPVQYMLVRGDLWARASFDAGYDLESPAYSPANSDAAFVQLNGQSDDLVFASNIIDFGVRFFRINAEGMREKILFPVDGSDGVLFRGFTQIPDERYPQEVEIMVRILTPKGEQLIGFKEEAGTNMTAEWWDIALEHSRVFTRTVKLPASPPFISSNGTN